MLLYLIDIGILLENEDPEFEYYNIVYDHKYGYYDKNQYYKKSKDVAIKEAMEYVKNGPVGAYAVVTLQDGFDDNMKDDDIAELNIESPDYIVSAVIYSIKKDKDEKLLESFIMTDSK